MNSLTLLLIVVALGLSNALIRGKRLRGNEPCTEPGFFRDADDCTKFYRCAEHDTKVEGLTYITKVQFNCPAGTIFDESVSTCNHYDFVADRPAECQRPVVPQPAPEQGNSNNDGNNDGAGPTDSIVRIQAVPALQSNGLRVVHAYPFVNYIYG